MSVQYLEHYLIQTADFAGTVAWYRDVIGLVPGVTPNFGFPVQWMYIGDRDVLHITHGGKKVTENRKLYLEQRSSEVIGTGVIDHVGFRCDGLKTMMDHLRAKKIEFRERRVDNEGLYQLFLFDPNMVKIELNFSASEAVGMVPEINAQHFTYQDIGD